jgi:hypothetical protein
VDPPIEPTEDLTLEELLAWGVADHIEEIEEMSVHANKQFGLEKQLANMKGDWGPIEFEVSYCFLIMFTHTYATLCYPVKWIIYLRVLSVNLMCPPVVFMCIVCI